MKRTIILLIMLLAGVWQLPASQDQFPIPLDESQDDPHIVRFPSSFRIDCLYDTDYSSFIFNISGNSDCISVYIERTGNTEIYETELIGNGLFYVPISGNSGLWRIDLTLPNGIVYHGSFII